MILEAHNTMHLLITQYGSFALFSLLAFGIIGLPIPDETLLLATGFMAAKGELSLAAALIAAMLGSCIGITVSYALGRYLGTPAVLKFGKYFGMTEAKLHKGHDWFERMGKYLLFVGYFIPGVRHFTGICAGTTELEYKTFAIFAYAGAIAFTTSFILDIVIEILALNSTDTISVLHEAFVADMKLQILVVVAPADHRIVNGRAKIAGGRPDRGSPAGSSCLVELIVITLGDWLELLLATKTNRWDHFYFRHCPSIPAVAIKRTRQVIQIR